MVHVLCFGNLLHGDDGFGIHVHRQLSGRLCAERTTLIEAGTRSMDVLAMLDRPSHVVLVDALHHPQSCPGTVRVIDGNALDAEESGAVHGGGVSWLVQAMRVSIAPAPRVTLVGAVVSGVRGFVPHLSSALAERIEEVAGLVEQLADGK